jgi:hypothetical protein
MNRRSRLVLGALVATAVGCGGSRGGAPDSGAGDAAGAGGVPGSGGAVAGSGGRSGSGGAQGSGGAAGTGGTPGSGGAQGSGGAAGTGGALGLGGRGDGGVVGTGGTGTGGTAGPAPYFGCVVVGGAGDRASIGKRDTPRQLCFHLTFDDIRLTPTAGLTLPEGWGNAAGAAYGSSTCSGTPRTEASSITGTVARSPTDAGAGLRVVDVDVVLNFPAGSIPESESLRVDGLVMQGPCN